jgi:FixJ family two-component response regulator
MTSDKPVPTIGIVDDDEGIRQSIGSLVRSAGYQSALFESAEAFLDSTRKHEICCLIVDVHMPGLDGLELQRVLNQLDHSIPMIVISARGDEVRKRALEQGAIAVLGKPFSHEALLGAITSALKGREED